MFVPTLHSGNAKVDLAYRIALGTLTENIAFRRREGMMPADAPVILAGLQYEDPWTRCPHGPKRSLSFLRMPGGVIELNLGASSCGN